MLCGTFYSTSGMRYYITGSFTVFNYFYPQTQPNTKRPSISNFKYPTMFLCYISLWCVQLLGCEAGSIRCYSRREWSGRGCLQQQCKESLRRLDGCGGWAGCWRCREGQRCVSFDNDRSGWRDIPDLVQRERELYLSVRMSFLAKNEN
jgi:hypothetical protein